MQRTTIWRPLTRPARTLRQQLARIAERPAHRRRGHGIRRAEVDVRGRVAHPPLEVARYAGNDVEVRPEAIAVTGAGAAGGREELRTRRLQSALDGVLSSATQYQQELRSLMKGSAIRASHLARCAAVFAARIALAATRVSLSRRVTILPRCLFCGRSVFSTGSFRLNEKNECCRAPELPPPAFVFVVMAARLRVARLSVDDRDAVLDRHPHQAGVGAIERADALRHVRSGDGHSGSGSWFGSGSGTPEFTTGRRNGRRDIGAKLTGPAGPTR